MKRDAIYIIGGLVMLALVVLFFQGRARDAEARFRADRDRIQASADSSRAAAQRAAVLADSAERRAVELAARAATAAREVVRWRTRIDTVTVPAAALPFTAPRDSLIRVLTVQVDTLGAALEAQRRATSALRGANAGLVVAVDSLQALVDRAPVGRPKLFGLIPLPEITVGYSAGIDRQTRKLIDGPAVHIGYRIGL